jgi:hypothetical protein
MHCKCFCRIFSKSSCPMDRHGNVSTLSTSYKKWKVSSHFYTRAQFLSNIFTETYTYIEVLYTNKLDRKQCCAESVDTFQRRTTGRTDPAFHIYVYYDAVLGNTFATLFCHWPRNRICDVIDTLVFVGVSLTPQCCWWINDTPLLLAPYSSSVSPTLGSPLSQN